MNYANMAAVRLAVAAVLAYPLTLLAQEDDAAAPEESGHA